MRASSPDVDDVDGEERSVRGVDVVSPVVGGQPVPASA